MNDPKRLIDILERIPTANVGTEADQREENLRGLIRAAMPAAEVSEALSQRVRDLEAAAAPSPTPSLPSRLFPARVGWALAAAAILAGIAAPILWPRWVAAQTLRRMASAIDDVRSAHEVFWRVSADGRHVKAGESWYQAGRWRLLDLQNGNTSVFAHGKLWSYDHKANEVTVHRTSGPFGYNPSGFSLAAMKRDYARWGWRYQVRVLGSTAVDGRPAQQVVIQQRGEERSLFQVDAANDLPIRSEYQREAKGRWITEFATAYHFNDWLPASLFVPVFPADAKRQDWDAAREQWRRRLAKGIARRHIAGRLIVIRDLWVNPDGDVFLLYTAGTPPAGFFPDWRVSLADEGGTPYHEASGLDPYNIETHPVQVKGSNLWWGFQFGGEKLQGKWWVPAVRQHPWRPRHFTLTFHAAPTGDPKPIRPQSGKLRGDTPNAVTGTLTLRVDRAGSTLVPPFMPFMFDLMDEGQIRREEADARAAFYRHVQDPLKLLDLSQGARHPSDLLQALANYQEIVHMDETQARQTGDTPHDPGVWTNIGKVLYRLNRRDEARAAFERAIRQSRENDWSRQEPKQLLNGINSIMAWTPGHPAPPAAGTDLAGRPHAVADYRGRVLLISLWSRFSPEFKGERLRINSLNDRYRQAGLSVLGVAIDINRGDLMKYIQAQQIPWPNLYDDKEYQSEVAARFGYSWDFTRLPRTLLVDRQSIVRAVDLHGSALDKAVAKLLVGQ